MPGMDYLADPSGRLMFHPVLRTLVVLFPEVKGYRRLTDEEAERVRESLSS